MATLAEIKKQIAGLEKKAEALIKAESAQAIAKVKELIERYGLSAEDLGFGGKRGGKGSGKGAATKTKKSAVGSVGVPMYRDPASGKTWTGRGKPPVWIAGAKDRARFLIGAEGSAAGTEGKGAAKSTRTKVAKKVKPTRAARKAAPKAGKKGAARKVANVKVAAAAPAASRKVAKKAAAGSNRRVARKAVGGAAATSSSVNDTAPATTAAPA